MAGGNEEKQKSASTLLFGGKQVERIDISRCFCCSFDGETNAVVDIALVEW